jgi:hypothetical protein
LCSIGWLKTEGGWLLFKNRDRYKSRKPARNYLEATDNTLLFKDREHPGTWLGINRHGLGIVTSLGAVESVTKKSYEENLLAIELALQEAETLKQAMDICSVLGEEVDAPYSIIFADSEQAFCMEQMGRKTKVERSKKRALRTNHLLKLDEFNYTGEEFANSKKRLEVLRSLTDGRIGLDGIKAALKYRSEENSASPNRIGKFETIACAILEIKGKNVTANYLLNKAPHKGEYKKKEWSLD